MENCATSALSFMSLFGWLINFYRYSASLDWLATAARASCLTIGSSSSFYMHSLTNCSYFSHPIWPKMKQISCFSKLVCVLKYSFDKSWHKVFLASSLFSFLIKYIIRYLLKSDTSSRRRSPRYLFSWKRLSSLLSFRNASNSSLEKGAAGSFVL